MVRWGVKPLASSISTASSWLMRLPLSSQEPRPQTKPPWMAPEYGGCSQSPSVPGATGTTSWCAISITGAALASLPGQV
ncbi:hypothetical protein D3C72_2207380 [compost metagenome]